MADRKSSAAVWVTANERFKTRSEDWMTMGVVAAVVAHFALFALFPTLNAEDINFTSDEIAVVDLPPEVKIPPPPEQIARPATPRVAAAALDEDITIARTDFESNPIENLPPPPAGARPSDVPSYIARDVNPFVKNGSYIAQLLKRRYPSMLKEAGIGGSVTLWLWVEPTGVVTKAVVHESSGYPQLDNTAMEVAKKIEFSPAMIRDRAIGVWAAQQFDFSTKN